VCFTEAAKLFTLRTKAWLCGEAPDVPGESTGFEGVFGRRADGYGSLAVVPQSAADAAAALEGSLAFLAAGVAYAVGADTGCAWCYSLSAVVPQSAADATAAFEGAPSFLHTRIIYAIGAYAGCAWCYGLSAIVPQSAAGATAASIGALSVSAAIDAPGADAGYAGWQRFAYTACACAGEVAPGLRADVLGALAFAEAVAAPYAAAGYVATAPAVVVAGA
jgi:hypothetical protein